MGTQHRGELCCSSALQAEWPETHISTSHQAAYGFAQATGHCVCSNSQQRHTTTFRLPSQGRNIQLQEPKRGKL